jgi:D-glycero-alpha-D-manno-heptose-7-phosphate kinase
VIIARAPLRISFGGGGSDLPVYYRKWGGAVLSASIDKYVYIHIHPAFDERRIQLKYAQSEDVDHHSLIKHRIFRTVLDRFKLYGVELVSVADIPSGTGLGSSSTFTVALLQCIYAHLGVHRSRAALAEEACSIEIDELKSPIGRQDQYAAAFGGINHIRFEKDDSVYVEPITITRDRLRDFDSRLLLFYTGVTRDANDILEDQARSFSDHTGKETLMHKMVELGGEMRVCLQQGKLDEFGALLHESWKLKRSLSTHISNSRIDDLYERARSAGATGGKILGAGGGGFLLLYCPPERQPILRQALSAWREFPFKLESGGTQIIYYER